MPTEEESLQIRVSLDNKASAGIRSIHEKIKSISHERHKEFFDKLGREFKSFRPLIGDANVEFGKVAEQLSVFTRFGGAVGGTIAAIAIAAVETARKTKEFSDELNEVFRIATYSGFGAQQLRNLYEVLRGVNDIPPEQFEAIANSVGESIDELLREGSPLRQWFQSQTPAMGKAAEAFLGSMVDEAKRRDIGALMQRILNLPDYLEKLAREQGLSPEQAAGIRRRAGERLRLPASVSGRVWGEIKTATKEEEEKLNALHKQTLEMERQMGRVKDAAHEINTLLEDMAAASHFDENGIIVRGFKWTAEFIENLY